ncbi:unnamed protein product [Didymodactylos carnosus]|uniref:Metallo-beta-lactamase domain-containing protein n=1 Tax=Didymodactylos carnosus TaxID=1234261 RepID=A0A8S2PNB0_9BILA|nr:unnamed protein product [Didymodactylos carnosus]CAF4057551.1 unnamed protein product [Didymodactylos carnosus]
MTTLSTTESKGVVNVYQVWNYRLKLDGFNLSLRGHSRAAEKTGFYIPELDIMLDAGLQSPFHPKLILITHGHSDHSFALPMILTGIKSIPTIYVPNNTKHFYDQFIQSVACLTSQDSEAKATNFDLQDVKPGPDRLPFVTKNQTFYVQVFSCDHSIDCVGYGLMQSNKRLKEEYKNQTKDEIIACRKTGIEIMESYIMYILAYLGDTTPLVFAQEPDIFQYKYIMIECTYLYSEDLELAMKNKHSCFTQLKEIITSHPENTFILIHFSLRYSAEEIRSFFLTEENRLHNIIVWTN